MCSGSGCGTALLVILALGFMVEAWQEASMSVRFLLIFGTIALACFGVYGWERYTRQPRP